MNYLRRITATIRNQSKLSIKENRYIFPVAEAFYVDFENPIESVFICPHSKKFCYKKQSWIYLCGKCPLQQVKKI